MDVCLLQDWKPDTSIRKLDVSIWSGLIAKIILGIISLIIFGKIHSICAYMLGPMPFCVGYLQGHSLPQFLEILTGDHTGTQALVIQDSNRYQWEETSPCIRMRFTQPTWEKPLYQAMTKLIKLYHQPLGLILFLLCPLEFETKYSLFIIKFAQNQLSQPGKY